MAFEFQTVVSSHQRVGRRDYPDIRGRSLGSHDPITPAALLVSHFTSVNTLVVTSNHGEDTALVAAIQDRPIYQRLCATMVGHDSLNKSLAIQRPMIRHKPSYGIILHMEISLEIPGYLECCSTTSLA